MIKNNNLVQKFGIHQIKIFVGCLLVFVASGISMTSTIFTGYTPHHRCQVPDCEANNTNYYSNMDNGNKSLPGFYDGEMIEADNECVIPQYKIDPDGHCYEARFMGPNLEECDGNQLVVDRTIVSSTLVEDFGYLCDSGRMAIFLSLSHNSGKLFGSIIFGWISDKYGRLKGLIMAILTMSLSGIGGIFIGGKIGAVVYLVLRFLSGAGAVGSYIVAFVLSVEHIRNVEIGIFLNLFYAVGESLLGLEAFLIRDWRYLQLLAYSPMLILIGLYQLIPESPRWLRCNGKGEEAEDIFEKADNESSCKGKNNNRNRFYRMNSIEEKILSKEVNATIFDAFQHEEMLFRTFNMGLQWFSVTSNYHGLSYISTSLSGTVTQIRRKFEMR